MNDSAEPSPVSSGASARSRLLGIKLRALVGEHRGTPLAEGDGDPYSFPDGAAFVAGDTAWVLVDGDASAALGRALAWSIRHGAAALNLVADRDTGLLARRAAHVTFPIDVWFAEGRSLLPAVPEPLAEPPGADPDHLDLAPLITAARADVNVEHGVVFGEVRGLEVCRVVAEPTTGTIADGELGALATARGAQFDDGVLLEVGVGANDREAFRIIHGDIPTPDALASVVDSVIAHRREGAPQHPLNRLARERYLRWRLQQHPELVGMVDVAPAEPPVPRPNLRDAVPCVAAGVRDDGAVSTIVCSTGVDLDLVGYVADLYARGDAAVVVALPGRDRLPITDELLGTLVTPVDIVTVD